MGDVFHLADMGPEASCLLTMPKDVIDGRYDYDWPSPGDQLRIELESPDDRSVRFFLDIHEGKRTSRVALSVNDLRERKAKMQTRASSSVLARIDYTTVPEAMIHTNPDGTRIEGTHVHLRVDGYGNTIALPLEGQDVICPEAGLRSASGLLLALMDASSVTRGLRIASRLEGV